MSETQESTRIIIRGDSYALRRPLYTYTLVEIVNDEFVPMNLAGCTIRTTYRKVPTSIQDDPTDESAIWKGTLKIDSNGVPQLVDGIVLKGLAQDGVVEVHLSDVVSRQLPANTPLISDLEVTDAQGEKFTFIFEEKLELRDGITHRLED